MQNQQIWQTLSWPERRAFLLLTLGASATQADILKQREWPALSRWAKMAVKSWCRKNRWVPEKEKKS